MIVFAVMTHAAVTYSTFGMWCNFEQLALNTGSNPSACFV